MDAHQQLLSDLRTGLRQFEARVDARFVQIDARFTQMDTRLLTLDQKVDTGFAGVRHEMALQFRWLVGIMLTGMLTIAAAILAG